MQSYFRVVAFLAASTFASVLSANPSIDISSFDRPLDETWEDHSFEGDTHYERRKESDLDFLYAKSEASASGLVRELEVDLEKTPVLTWRWRVNEGIQGLDETTKNGDDYAARIYVVVSGGFFFWKTKALNFVWSGGESKGESWPNAFAPDNARMVALRDSRDPQRQWLEERVNVAELLSDWLGEKVTQIDAVAIMTDTDNSGLSAQADYASIRFEPE
jgi:hypothetical protein